MLALLVVASNLRMYRVLNSKIPLRIRGDLVALSKIPRGFCSLSFLNKVAVASELAAEIVVCSTMLKLSQCSANKGMSLYLLRYARYSLSQFMKKSCHKWCLPFDSHQIESFQSVSFSFLRVNTPNLSLLLVRRSRTNSDNY